MPVTKTITYKFDSRLPEQVKLFTTADMAKAIGVTPEQCAALIRSGKAGLSFHFSEPIWKKTRTKMIRTGQAYFWRVDGRDGDSFKKNIAEWKRLGKTVQRQLLQAIKKRKPGE